MPRFQGPLFSIGKERVDLVTRPGKDSVFKECLRKYKKGESDLLTSIEYLTACWTANQRPYCNVHASMMKTVTSRTLSKVILSDYMIPESCNLSGKLPTICFRFESNSNFPITWAIVGHVEKLSESFPYPAWVFCYVEPRKDNMDFIGIDYISYLPRDDSYPGSDIENDVIHNRAVNAQMQADGTYKSDHNCTPIYFLIMQTYAAFRLGSDFIVDDVPLAVDVDKWERTKNKALIDKARRRGVIGWDLGKHVETGPHMRRPHFGIRWKGTGHSRPELVPIRGCIVNGKKLKMPEGYEPVHD